MVATWLIIVIVAVVLLLIVYIYNSLIKLRVRVKNAWAQIDVQLKRRADLIPNLVNAVKGYMKHEKGVLTEVTKARTALMQAGGVKDKAKAENMLEGALKSLFAVAENYPDLKASQNFMQLQEELSGTESKIAYARQHYNDVVMAFNNKIQTFPNNAFAKMLSFKEEESFEATSAEKKNVKVEL